MWRKNRVTKRKNTRSVGIEVLLSCSIKNIENFEFGKGPEYRVYYNFIFKRRNL